MLASSRRKFLGSLGALSSAAGAGALWLKKTGDLEHIQISMDAPNFAAGHSTSAFTQPPLTTKQHTVVIAGGGISGLSAGWWLKKQGFTDFVILELEQSPGGNARSKSNKVSAYPLGAHYIPMPGPQALYLKTLFEDMGIIKGYGADGKPEVDEFALCHSPKERLLSQGVWQDTLIPTLGVSQSELDQIKAFQDFAYSFAGKKGKDGRFAFASPSLLSSTDPEFTKYDSISVEELLAEMHLDSKHLAWYLEYCCKDDFGTNLRHTSAWAILHYFNARSGNGGEVVTWPNGIGHVVSYLADVLKDHLIFGAAVKDIVQTPIGTRTLYQVHEKGSYSSPVSIHAIDAATVICTLPRFVCGRVLAQWRQKKPEFLDSFSYSPWVIANITLKDAKALDASTPLSWDNVSQQSNSLGYIVANHQDVNSVAGRVNITYYLPITEIEPRAARHLLFDLTLDSWRTNIVKDLEAMHPDITESIETIELWLWPHGMIRPTPGFITSQARQDALNPVGRIFFAHSDLSGMSLFEEAQYHGVEAAKRALHLSEQQS